MIFIRLADGGVDGGRRGSIEIQGFPTIPPILTTGYSPPPLALRPLDQSSNKEVVRRLVDLHSRVFFFYSFLFFSFLFFFSFYFTSTLELEFRVVSNKHVLFLLGTFFLFFFVSTHTLDTLCTQGTLPPRYSL